MTKNEFLKGLEEIINHPVFISDTTNALAEEIKNNCWYISLDDQLAQQINLEDLKDFLLKVKNNRKEQLAKSNISTGLLYYLWYDVQAEQLRFNFINTNHSELPFRAKINLVDTEEEIIKNYLESDDSEQSEELDNEPKEFVVNVYKEVISIL